jgi:hypothetical protein
MRASRRIWTVSEERNQVGPNQMVKTRVSMGLCDLVYLKGACCISNAHTHITHTLSHTHTHTSSQPAVAFPSCSNKTDERQECRATRAGPSNAALSLSLLPSAAAELTAESGGGKPGAADAGEVCGATCMACAQGAGVHAVCVFWWCADSTRAAKDCAVYRSCMTGSSSPSMAGSDVPGSLQGCALPWGAWISRLGG